MSEPSTSASRSSLLTSLDGLVQAALRWVLLSGDVPGMGLWELGLRASLLWGSARWSASEPPWNLRRSLPEPLRRKAGASLAWVGASSASWDRLLAGQLVCGIAYGVSFLAPCSSATGVCVCVSSLQEVGRYVACLARRGRLGRWLGSGLQQLQPSMRPLRRRVFGFSVRPLMLWSLSHPSIVTDGRRGRRGCGAGACRRCWGCGRGAAQRHARALHRYDDRGWRVYFMCVEDMEGP